MTKEQTCARIREIGIIPAIRVSSREDGYFAAESVARAGIPIVEITMTVPGAVELISDLTRGRLDIVVGAGTVLDIEVARQCKAAGAHFLTAPGFDAEIVRFANQENLASLPGALTPTEVVMAWKAGADFVKVFPCSYVGGEKYIRSLKIALPRISIIASGGVNQQTATGMILAGAEALGIGAGLIPAEAIQLRHSDRIRELARRFLALVKASRERVES